MVKEKIWSDKIKYFLLGISMAISIFFLMGNSHHPPKYGRYQLSTWGTAFGDFSGGCGAFVLDTATGKTKTAYLYIYGSSDAMSILRNNLGKSFHDIK